MSSENPILVLHNEKQFKLQQTSKCGFQAFTSKFFTFNSIYSPRSKSTVAQEVEN